MKFFTLAFLLGCIAVGSPLLPAQAQECADVDLAVANEGRLAADRARDDGRKPAEVLCFFGIKPGMEVFDFFSGGGYYTEILSHLVGEEGHVIAHNNNAYLGFAKDQLAQRYSDGRLTNVTRLTVEANELELEAASLDASLMILAFHDIYYVTDEDNWPTIDGARLLQEIYQGLKPGGVLGVVDHVAEAGSPEEVGTTLHRIDPAMMRGQLEAAGFVFEAESEALRNPGDDLTQPMYAEGIRGKTDRVIYRFRKPSD